jgi:hypothetical protein
LAYLEKTLKKEKESCIPQDFAKGGGVGKNPGKKRGIEV